MSLLNAWNSLSKYNLIESENLFDVESFKAITKTYLYFPFHAVYDHDLNMIQHLYTKLRFWAWLGAAKVASSA